MGRAGGTADSLLKQTFRPSPRSGGWSVLLAIGEKLVRQPTTAARSARRDHRTRWKCRSIGAGHSTVSWRRHWWHRATILRSEERRVGKECVRTYSTRVSQ